jgi:hypothetical protein
MTTRDHRLLLAIYRPRRERLLGWLVGRCYRMSETGLIGWLGDRLDDMRQSSLHRRAAGSSLHPGPTE